LGGLVIIGASAGFCDSGSEPSTYDKCKAAGGDTKSGTCVKPGFRCDGETGSQGTFGKLWYICQGDPPVWVKENPQPK
jgi:hypothetical protein